MPARSDRRELFRIFLVLLALTFVLRLPAFFTPVFNSDETFLATQAHVLNDGGQLYEEAIDRKPPIVPYVYAATFAFFETTALWSVRVVAMLAVALTALLLAIEGRRRYGARAGWIAGDPVRRRDGVVRAAGRPGRELRGVHAAVDDRGDPVRATRTRLPRRASRSRPRRWPSRPARRRSSRCSTSSRASRGKRGVGEVALGFTIPTALVALAMGPAQLLYWTVLGNGSYVGMKTMSTVVLTTFLFMTGMWALCNLPLLWKIPSAWGQRKLRALDGERDTDLWLWAISAAVSVAVGLRFFGHYYLQLAPPLALLAAGALVARQPEVGDTRRGVRPRDRVRVLGRRLLLPTRCAGAELRVGGALPRHHHQPRRPDLRVGQRARDLLGVGSASGDAVPHVVVPDRQLPGPSAGRRQHR